MKTRSRKRRKGKARAKATETADPFPKSWPGWVRKWIRKFESAEKGAFEDFLIELDHAPDWVIKMWRELLKISVPAIRWEDEELSGPQFLGSVVGHTESVFNRNHGLPLILEKVDRFSKQLNKKIRGTLTKQELALLRKRQRMYQDAIEAIRANAKRFLAMVEAAVGSKLKLVEGCVVAASRQPDEEKVEFFDAYVRALKLKIIGEDGHFFHEKPSHEKLHSTTILYLMVSDWRVVNDFKNFGEFRRWLSKKFGSQTIGSSDRLKKLCTRYGYNPGGSAGRPAGQSDKRDAIPECVTSYMFLSDVLKTRSHPKN
jgi:hypothetical protein